MSNTQRLVTGVATAAVIAGGSYLGVNYFNDDNAEFIDDVTAVEVNVPKVNIPKVSVPSIARYNVNIPEVNSIVVIKESELKKLGIDISQVSTSNIIIPDISGLDINIAKIDNTNVIIIPDIKVPEIENYNKRIPLVIEFQKLCSRLFKDKRNISYDDTFKYGEPITNKWIKIYNQTYNDLEYVPIKGKFKMIAEVKVPRSSKQYVTLDKHLNYYKKLGYTHVLVTFDGSETSSELANIISYVKSFDFKVFTAYGGDESLYITVFIDPNKLGDLLITSAVYSEGFLLGWRRTSLHLFLQDKEYVGWVTNTLRSVNPNIIIVGESYLGNSAISDKEGMWKVVHNNPLNESACLISGIGMTNVNISGAIKNLFKDVKSIPKLGLVTGDHPYYATRNNNGKSFEDNCKIKKSIETKFLKAGCIGTITLHGDGSGTNNLHKSSDNLCFESQDN